MPDSEQSAADFGMERGGHGDDRGGNPSGELRVGGQGFAAEFGGDCLGALGVVIEDSYQISPGQRCQDAGVLSSEGSDADDGDGDWGHDRG